MSHLSQKSGRKLTLGIVLALLLGLFLMLTGCESGEGDETLYHSENYGFSLSIPNEIYKDLIIKDEPGSNVVAFYHYHEKQWDDGVSEIAGDFFRIHVVSQSEIAPGQDYGGVYCELAEDDEYRYFFWYMIPDQCESTPLQEACEAVFDMIKEIQKSFVLDNGATWERYPHD